jgi:hypothetical protein
MERLAESILLTTNELSEGAPVSAKMFPASWNPLGSRSVSLSFSARLVGQTVAGRTGRLRVPGQKPVWNPSTLGGASGRKVCDAAWRDRRPVRCYVGERFGAHDSSPRPRCLLDIRPQPEAKSRQAERGVGSMFLPGSCLC